VEDDAYYPFGLRIAGISAKAALKPTAKYGYQGDYALEDAETGYNEFDLRTYDPQIGRWTGIDPYDEFASGYIGMGNNPVNFSDPSGGNLFEWFSHVNEDGSVTHKWIEGKGQGDIVEGWIWEGVDINAFKTISGNYAALHDHGVVEWLEFGRNNTFTPQDIPDVSDILPVANESTGLGNNALQASIISTINNANKIPVYSGPTIGVPGFKSELDLQADRERTLDYRRNNAYNDDGTEHWTRRFGENKHVQRFEDHIAKPTIEMASVVDGAILIRGGIRALGNVAAKRGSTTALAKYWPENGGALGKWQSEFLMPGAEIDRFGSGFGKYFSPRNTPMDMRALPGGNTGAYNAFKVVKPFEVQSSTIAPAFGKIGLGTQYLSPVNMNTLLKRGIIVPIK
jgi:RHS repeat-associated protein